MLFGASIWYLFIKKYDYEITFMANMAPIGAYHQVKNITSNADKLVNETLNFSDIDLKQEVIFANEKVFLDWKFESVNDTITKIKVGIVSKDHSVKNRVQVITGSSSLIKLIKDDLIKFRKELRRYSDTFKIIIDGKTEIPPMDVLLVSSETQRNRKAQEMMSQNSYLYPKLKEGKVEKKGYPFVKIEQWDINKDILQMNFGFPIVHKDSLPIDSIIQYKRINAQKALKATYYGNYIKSDEAWFALLEYARLNGIVVEQKPLEIFYNNPMQDGNELQWKAEIFLPIKIEE